MSKWYSGPFVARVEKAITELCVSEGLISLKLFEVEDLDQRWKQSAPQYMADSVPQIARYPMVAIAWAAYYGIGAAALWDSSWDKVKDTPDLYVALRDVRGYDYMDEYVMEDLMNLHCEKTAQGSRIVKALQQCAELAISLIRKEGIPPQSVEAFQMYAKTTQLFFRLGYTIALTNLGYKLEKIDFPVN